MLLPESLQKLRIKTYIKRFLLCFVLFSVITALVYYYRETIFSYELITFSRDLVL